MSLTTPEAELRALGSLRRQCLFAVTILLVEDSRSASEAIRLYAAESGARVRRADSLHAASRHLAIYRPNVVMVDLGLPDGDGMALIRHLASASTPLGAIVALSGHERAPGRPRRRSPAPPPASRSRSRACAPSRSACSRCCPTPTSRRRPDERELALAGPRLGAARRSTRTCAAPGRCWPRRCPADDAETIAYCAQFLGSVGEMLGDRDLAAAPPAARPPAAADAGARGRSSGGRLGVA